MWLVQILVSLEMFGIPMVTNRYSIASITESLIKRFQAKYILKGSCWQWTAFKDSEGYGWMRHNGRDGPIVAAHRLSWVIHNKQDWPLGLEARHLCNNPSCVNPEHITPGTAKENMDDRRKARKHWMPMLSCLSCKKEISGLGNLNQHHKANHD